MRSVTLTIREPRGDESNATQYHHRITTVGIDLAKKIFHLVGMDTTGKMVGRKRLTRHALVPFLAQLPPVTIGMEACGGAHDWYAKCANKGIPSNSWRPSLCSPM